MADDQQPDEGVSRSQGWALVDAAWSIVGSVGLCATVGYFADKHFGTKPWVFVGGAVFGLVSGMTLFFMKVLALAPKHGTSGQADGKREDRR